MMQEPCVFLIEDDESVRSAIERILTMQGMTVRAYVSPNEFLADYHPENPAAFWWT